MIVLDVRRAIATAVAEAGFDRATEPKLRPGGPPGTFASSIAFSLVAAAGTGSWPSVAALATTLASRLAAEDWIERAEAAGAGYLTITVTPWALAGVAASITAAGTDCARSDLLRGLTVPMVPPASLGTAATWEKARAALAAELTATLAQAAGATMETMAAVASDGTVVAGGTGADGVAGGTVVAGTVGGTGAAGAAGMAGPAGVAMTFAGADAVRFALARAIPGKPVKIDSASVARNSLDNPAYAVRYAHARAVSGVRWAATLAEQGEAVLPCLPADPASWALLDALSWLPERVAAAARRGRPDELARYLEGLASATIAALPHLGPADNERLALVQAMAQAARSGLAAGLGLLGVAAPDRL
jgi:arginyl-tRNA synthetase